MLPAAACAPPGLQNADSQGTACPTHSVTEAQQQQQRAERVKDPVSERLHFSAAAAKYREALQHPLNDEDKADAAMGLVSVSFVSREQCRCRGVRAALYQSVAPFPDARAFLFPAQGESLQKWAEAHVAASRAVALEPGVLAAEAVACTEACSLCSQSVDAYAHVHDASGAPREDALVNSGNVLCQWAELLATAQPSAAAEVDALLDRACSCYNSASAAAPPDAPADTELLSNWADALVRRAEGCAAMGDGAAAGDLYQRALRTYEAACAGADVSFGDDVAVRPCGGLCVPFGAVVLKHCSPPSLPRAWSTTGVAPCRHTRATCRAWTPRPKQPRWSRRRPSSGQPPSSAPGTWRP